MKYALLELTSGSIITYIHDVIRCVMLSCMYVCVCWERSIDGLGYTNCRVGQTIEKLRDLLLSHTAYLLYIE
jgi:hypothetical protein